MVMSDVGKMKRDGVYVSVEVRYSDDYDVVVKKAAETLKIDNTPNLRLLKPRGALLPRSGDWCIGVYKRSLHSARDAVQLGIGPLRLSMDPTSVCLHKCHLVL